MPTNKKPIPPTATSKWEYITPDIAQKFLEVMGPNQKVSQKHVDYLVSAMKTGEWIEGAGDPIQFNEQGEFINGQHRMWAIIESGMSFYFNVMRGLPIAAMGTIDTGRSRSLKAFLEIAKEANASTVSAVLYNLYEYQNTGEISKGWSQRLSTKKAFLMLQDHPSIRDSAAKALPIQHVLRGGQGRWATMHYILSNIDYDDAEFFFDKLTTGEGLPSNSPIALLRGRMLDVRYSNRQKMAQRDFSALIFKAWNLYRTGTTIQQLSFRGGGANPEQYPKPV